MNKKNIIILIITLIVVIGGGGFYVLEKNQMKNTQTVDENGVVQTKVNLKRVISSIDNKYLNDAQFTSCVSENINNCLNQSIYEQLFSTRDISLCNDFFQKDQQEACRETFINDEAIKNLDISKCETLKNPDSCQREVLTGQALKEKDIKICDALKKEEVSDSDDLNLLDNSYERCRTTVARNLAFETRDKKYCALIKEEDEKQFCLDSLSFDDRR